MKMKDYNSLGFKNPQRTIKPLPQVGKSDRLRDQARPAMPPGKRISKTGKIYWETRKNRSDVRGKTE